LLTVNNGLKTAQDIKSTYEDVLAVSEFIDSVAKKAE
jgi:hypothetical protein